MTRTTCKLCETEKRNETNNEREKQKQKIKREKKEAVVPPSQEMCPTLLDEKNELEK